MKVVPAIHAADHHPGGPDPIEGHWHAVLPVAPGFDDPQVYRDGPDFEGAWGNIDGYPPTAFKKIMSGLRMRMSATGDEDNPGSTIFTLPSGYHPTAPFRLFAMVGVDGTGIGTVEVGTDGVVTWVGEIGT